MKEQREKREKGKGKRLKTERKAVGVGRRKTAVSDLQAPRHTFFPPLGM